MQKEFDSETRAQALNMRCVSLQDEVGNVGAIRIDPAASLFELSCVACKSDEREAIEEKLKKPNLKTDV